MRNICPAQNCTGCMACASVCAHKAIEIHQDELGFQRPLIVEERCISCGLCYATCPERNRVNKRFPKECYAAIINDDEIRNIAASGGIATALAKHIIAHGGYVVACSGEDIKHVHHRFFTKDSDLHYIAGSRYVQSEISPDLLKKMRSLVNSGKQILFIGTGCQTAGVLRLFPHKPKNLFVVDLVCHGIASQKMLNENIAYYETRYHGLNIDSISFRLKTKTGIKYGWSMALQTPDGIDEVTINWQEDAYLAAFLDYLSLRECCAECRYAFSARATDITLADFWGLGKDSLLAKNVGTSAILINTEIGSELFHSLHGLMKEKREVGEAVKGIGRLQRPSPRNEFFPLFKRIMKEHGFVEAVRHTSIKKYKEENFRQNHPYLTLCKRLIRKIGRFKK